MFNQPIKPTNDDSFEEDEDYDDIYEDEDGYTKTGMTSSNNNNLGMENLRSCTENLNITNGSNENIDAKSYFNQNDENLPMNLENNDSVLGSHIDKPQQQHLHKPHGNLPAMTPIVERTENISEYENTPSKPKVLRKPRTDVLIPKQICDPTLDADKNLILKNAYPFLNSLQTLHLHTRIKLNKGKKLKSDFLQPYELKYKTKGKDNKKKVKTPPPVLIELPRTNSNQGNRMYGIIEMIGTGGFGSVYLIESENGEHLACKIEDIPSIWEYYIICRLHYMLSSDPLATPSVLNSVINISDQYIFTDESLMIMDYIESQCTILDVANLARNEAAEGSSGGSNTIAGNSDGGVNETLAIFIVVELIRVIEAIHRHGIIHCDLKPENVMMRFKCYNHKTKAQNQNTDAWSEQYKADGSNGWKEKGIVLIDFGRSIDFNDPIYDTKTTRFKATWNPDAQDCVEVQKRLPWTFQVDYHGVASIAYLLLFGKFIEITTRKNNKTGAYEASIVGSIKRYWQQKLWTRLFHILLNSYSYSNNGENWPITDQLAQIRGEFEEYLEQTTGIINNNSASVHDQQSLKSCICHIEQKLSK